MKYMQPIHSGGEARDSFNNLIEVKPKQIIEEFSAITEAPRVFEVNQPHPADAATTVRPEGGRTLMDGPFVTEPESPVASLVTIRTLQALALQARDDEEGSPAVLADALVLASTDGSVRVVAEKGPRMAVLLRRSAPAAATLELIEPLTARELEVLGLIAVGKSNRNIADELVVTLDTAKKHASHIFAKLGAANRTEAVRHAQQLGLLSTSAATLGLSGCPLRGCPFVERTAVSF